MAVKKKREVTLDIWLNKESKKSIKTEEKYKETRTDSSIDKNIITITQKSNDSPTSTNSITSDKIVSTINVKTTTDEIVKSGSDVTIKKEEKAKSMNGNIKLEQMIKEFLEKIRIPEIKTLNRRRFEIDEITRHARGILIVTEKQKVAKAFASIFPQKKTIKNNGVVIYEALWNAKPIYIVPMRGHITEIIPVEEFSGDWEKSDPIKLLEFPSLREVIKVKSIAKIIKQYAKKSDVLFIATDADEEGSNIGLEAYNIARSENPNIKVYRLWFVSLQKQELLEAFRNPLEMEWSWAWAVQGRRYIDAMVGFSATRELTIALRDLVKALKVRAFSIGRVQTPTLYLLYLREKEIRSFKPRPYWSFSVGTILGEHTLSFLPVNSPYYDEKKALNEYNAVKNEKSVRIIEVMSEDRRVLPPQPLDTTAALSMLNEILGLSSKRAMDILEDLYLNGLITYPRTETNKYPDNYNHAKNLLVLQKHPSLGVFAKKALEKGAKPVRNGSKFIGDHLPITPIDLALPGDKRLPTKTHKDVYELIVRRYISIFLPLGKVTKLIVKGKADGILLKATVSYIRERGFLEVYPYPAKGLSNKALKVNEGDALKIHKISKLERKLTKPPERLTESQLIKLMEKLGLGTKSTRPDHIETLVSRRYSSRKGRKLVITDIGYALMEQLESIWPDFLKPYFSARVHIAMRKVMNEELEWRQMIDLIRDEFIHLFKELRNNIVHMKHAIKKASEALIESEALLDCPKCKVGKMILVNIPKRNFNLLKCTNCSHTLLIPKAVRYERTGLKCKKCGAEILVLHRRDSILVICPVCWREIGHCMKCPLRDSCPASKVIEKYLIVGPCSCGKGKLMFIRKYNLVRCDSCDEKYYLPKKARNVKLLSKKCPTCNLRLFSFNLPNRKGRVKFCVKCRKYFS